VRRRSATITHVQMVNHQQNLPAFEKSISYKANRVGIADRFEGDSLQQMVTLDVDLIDFYVWKVAIGCVVRPSRMSAEKRMCHRR